MVVYEIGIHSFGLLWDILIHLDPGYGILRDWWDFLNQAPQECHIT